MATIELYNGGPRQHNSGYAMYPNSVFNVGAVRNQRYSPFDKYQPVTYATSRTLDFTGGDEALSSYLSTVPIVTGDIIGTSVIPDQSLIQGVWWQVVTPLTGVSFTLKLRIANITLLAAQSGAVVSSGFAPVTAILLPDPYLALAEMVDVVMTAVPLAGLKGFSLCIAPYFANFQASES